jgi:hypothetical protein
MMKAGIKKKPTAVRAAARKISHREGLRKERGCISWKSAEATQHCSEITAKENAPGFATARPGAVKRVPQTYCGVKF